MGTNCVPLVADLFLFCYLFQMITDLKLLNLSTSRYLDDLLNICNNFFDNMVNHNYPSEHQLNKANVSKTQPHFGFTCICIGWFC